MFDFFSLASSITASPSDSSNDRLVNERIVYSPLVWGDVAKNERPLSAIVTEAKEWQSPNRSNKSNRERSGQNPDDAWSDSETCDPIVRNLNATTSYDKRDTSNDIKVHDAKFDQETNNGIVNKANNNTNINNGEGIPFKESKLKPPRPPPPSRLLLTDSQNAPDGNLSPKLNQSNPHTPDSSRKGFTPTFSRLMANLPLSPKRGRRISWGGESDLSIGSPRSMKSPADQSSLQTSQWDMMISRPKQWIYCWQTLVVSVSER